jgi:hypothetical protein
MLAFGGIAAGADELPPEGPSGSPSGGVTSLWAGDQIFLDWINGDSSASTQIYFKDDAGGCPTGGPEDEEFIATKTPGATSHGTSKTSACNFFLRHVKNGQYSAWHQVTSGVESCSACPL